MKQHFLFLLLGSLLACQPSQQTNTRSAETTVTASPAETSLAAEPAVVTPLVRSDAEWQKLLSPNAYEILRQSGTERAFTGAYWDNHEAGSYYCAGCGLHLFDATDKFDSGTGWPSFTKPFRKEYVKEISDKSYGMVRTEVRCARCDGHLGHVFDDGPAPTNMRYCMNSASLVFVKK